MLKPSPKVKISRRPVAHTRRGRVAIKDYLQRPSSDSNLHDFGFRVVSISRVAPSAPRARPDRADPECRERTECRVAGVVNRSPRGTHDTRKHTFTATVTDKSRGDIGNHPLNNPASRLLSRSPAGDAHSTLQCTHRGGATPGRRTKDGRRPHADVDVR